MRTAIVLGKALVLSLSLFVMFSCSNESESESASVEKDTLWIAGAGHAPAAALALDGYGAAESFSSHFYAAYISQNEDCSGAIEVSNHGETPVFQDLMKEPMLFNGDVAVGTYKCLIVKISNSFAMSPNADAVASVPGVCSAGVQTLLPVCQATYLDWKDHSGAVTSCDQGNVAPVYIFASTDPEAVKAGPLATAALQTVVLNGALEVPGKVTFHIDTTNQIADVGGVCGLLSSPLGFTKN